MPWPVLDEAFFARRADIVARSLVGKYLVRDTGEAVRAVRITETEAYMGPHDLACHAAKGRTARTAVMFEAPGTLYVYFIYGMYWMLNVVTAEVGYPAAVLIRGADSASGPGRLTRALAITGALNGSKAEPATGLWFEDRGSRIPARHILSTPRIGVDYAGEWADKKYRFVLTE